MDKANDLFYNFANERLKTMVNSSISDTIFKAVMEGKETKVIEGICTSNKLSAKDVDQTLLKVIKATISFSPSYFYENMIYLQRLLDEKTFNT
jgi:hypothetical protein